MTLLKRLPVHYKGELHDVRLINFTVEKKEVIDRVPARIKVRDFKGRAMISMVDVRLVNMRPVSFPFIRFNYRHVAFRLLVDDSKYNGGTSKGIFFFRSFTDKPLIVFGGSLMTDYNLEVAAISARDNEVTIQQGDKFVRYRLDVTGSIENQDLKNTVGVLDRAYSVFGNTIRVTQIQRERWPIRPVDCNSFAITFFETAKFEGAFRVPEVIHYDWLPPEEIAS